MVKDVEDTRREVAADIMNAATEEFGRFLSKNGHLRLTEIIYDHVKKALSRSEWDLIADSRKMNTPWEKHIPYHCNCENQEKDPRVCPDHGRVKEFKTDILSSAIPDDERKK